MFWVCLLSYLFNLLMRSCRFVLESCLFDFNEVICFRFLLENTLANGQYSEWFVFRVVIGYSKASASL